MPSGSGRGLISAVGPIRQKSEQADILQLIPRRDQAQTWVRAMAMQVKSTWHQVARGAGVSEAHCELISGAIAYPGFDLPLPMA